MDRRIRGFHQDAEGHWVADLECGHAQHVRHDPPWQLRPWVLKEESRLSRLGLPLDCPLCDAHPRDNDAAAAAYRDALLRGLCPDGAREIQRQVLQRQGGRVPPVPGQA